MKTSHLVNGAATILAGIFASLITMATISAGASGSRVGSGGVGILCSRSPSLELLDLHEATQLYGRTIYINPFDRRNLQEWVTAYGSRLEEILGAKHPFVISLGDTAHLLATGAIFEDVLPMTQDLGWGAEISEGCALKQIAIRGQDHLSGRLLISREYWDAALPKEQALLIIHEAAHSWFSQSADSSVNGTLAIRQFVGLLYTDSSDYPGISGCVRELVKTREPLPKTRMTDQSLRR